MQTTTRPTTSGLTTTALISSPWGRFVDPEDLICPGCGEQVRCAPPGYWRVTDGLPVPQFSHHDATPLCRTRSGAVTEPIEAPVESPLKDSRAEAGERP
jgi:hypothetical protein